MISFSPLKDFWKRLFPGQGSSPTAERMKEEEFDVMVDQNPQGRKARRKNLFSGMGPMVHNPRSTAKDFPTSPVSRRTSYVDQGELLLSQSSLYDSSFRIRLYRFLRDNIPVLNSAVWTWTRICASPSYPELKGSDDPKVVDNALEVISNLDGRIYQHSFQKFGGADALLMPNA